MNISIIGLGKLGSPLAAVFASKGHKIVGVDLNSEFVEKINTGIAPVSESQLQELITAHHANLQATTSYEEAILSTDVTFVIVPTPSQEDGLFSNKYLLNSIKEIALNIAKKSTYHLVVITSTVTPGSTEGEIQHMLETHSGRVVGENLGLCYNPEFIALGTVVRDMLFPDMILVGESDPKAGSLLEEIYRSSCNNTPPVQRMSLVNAEIAKIAINTYVTTKISYANMISDICQNIPGGDALTVTQAVGLDSRIGRKYLIPAIGFGGPCFPRDNIALAAIARKVGAKADLAVATQTINTYQNERLVDLVEKNSTSKKIGILGLAYKPGTYVVEESQGIQLANTLQDQGYSVSVFDPMALSEAKKELLPQIAISTSAEECVRWADTIVIMIPWPEFKETIQSESAKKTVIDCWRMLDHSQLSNSCDLIYMGYGKPLEDSKLISTNS